MRLVGNDMPDAAAGLGDVALVAGNQVHMKMQNRLAGGGPAIDANVVAIGAVGRFDHRVGVGNSPTRDQQRVPRRNREGIP